MTVASVSYMGQNWTITPVGPGPNEPAPRSFFEQKWLLVETGVVATDEQLVPPPIIGIHGNNPMIGVGEASASTQRAGRTQYLL